MRHPFTCLYREIWDDPKIYSMSESGQLVYVYLISCPLGNGLGCFKAGMAALEEDFRAGAKPFRKGLAEVFEHGLANYDPTVRVMFVPSYLFRNPPSNPNGIKALSKEYVRIPDCQLKLECFRLVEKFVGTKGEGFQEAFRELFEEPLLEQPGIVPIPIPVPIPVPIPTPVPNCEPVKTDIAIVKKKKNTSKPKSTNTWVSYSDAYKNRYGTEPIRNQSVNAILCRFVDAVGMDNAPQIARYYLTCSNHWYLTKGHDVQTMLGNAQKLHTEWKTGSRISTQQARDADRLQGTGDVWNKIIQENNNEESKNG